jgi:hypothetical protein
VQQVKQDHRIHPAGNRHQDPLSRAKEPADVDALLDAVQQFAHDRMLFPHTGEARKIAQATFAICHLPFAIADATHRVTRPVTRH